MALSHYLKTWRISYVDDDAVAILNGEITFIKCNYGHVHCTVSENFSTGDWEMATLHYSPKTDSMSGVVTYPGGRHLLVTVSRKKNGPDSWQVLFRVGAGSSPGGDATGDDTGD